PAAGQRVRHAGARGRVDGVGVLTGSFNWTTSAEDKNAENLVWIPDAATAALYLANYATISIKDELSPEPSKHTKKAKKSKKKGAGKKKGTKTKGKSAAKKSSKRATKKH
ncbi:MAG: hypothetical protein ABSG48_08195, partial [Geobacteraceae bacterium]